MKEEKRNNHKVEQKRQKGWREGRRDSKNGDCKQLVATIATLRHDTFDPIAVLSADCVGSFAKIVTILVYTSYKKK